jgi:threonine aldolase
MIDLRSDTVTLPSPAMREAIARAELGDDVYGEDPTINRLEELAADMMGKEAALLVTSGTQGNLTALLAQAARGTRVILGDQSHIYCYEAGGASALGGLIYHTLPNQADGTLDLEQVRDALVRNNDPHLSPPGIVCLENTHNRCGGVIISPEYMAKVHDLARWGDVPLHLDGARIFNSAVALGIPLRELTRHVDTVQFCLSKGLAAPVGSMVAGSRQFIAAARRVRKMLGGGMRQAGVIAAAGIVALEEMIERMAEDHANARILAEGLAAIPGISLDPAKVQTNIIYFDVDVEGDSGEMYSGAAGRFATALRERGVLLNGSGGRSVRAVTHYGISEDDVRRAVAAVADVMQELPVATSAD